MTNADDGLLRDVRTIRRLAGPPESPWSGDLAVLPTDRSCLLVDAEDLGVGWAGWSAPGDGHVIGPLDVLRTAQGHLVALPVCRERLDDVISRREASGAALTDGERLTIAVSLLRGCSALEPATSGEWWMTDDARPVYAALPRGDSAELSASRTLDALSRDTARLAGPLADAAALVLDRERLLREAERLEERLFGLAAAEPVALTAFAPRHARTLSAHRDGEPAASDAVESRGLWGTLVRHVDADLADAVSQVTTGVWRRFRRPRPTTRRRTGPWLAAGAIAVAIVGGAALVPSAADEPVPSVSRTADPMPPDSPAPPSPNTSGAVDGVAAPEAALTDIVTDLLDRRAACAGAEECLVEVVADAATVFPSGAIDLASDERSAALIDDFGGVAVLRVMPAAGTSAGQLVVMVLTDGKWLLRDVHDVAEQP
ncbi:hypothetical protein [Microbacterium sp. RU33B]|uniref:hypothetical protein n=1 Tax=Microbacterium sp. RU33B TaxID=1907390 RepID=UPI00117FF1CB|nr:hypothetical protein [Microbacterium sp. RU33B]